MPEAAVRPRFSGQSVAIALAIVAALISGGCNLLDDSSSPSSPSPATSTETFNGSVGVQGTSRTTFTVAQAGVVSVTLATMSPSAAMGLGIGTPNGTTACSLTSSNTSAIAGSSPQLTVTEQPGSYCVSVYDVGNLTGVATFTVTVAHP